MGRKLRGAALRSHKRGKAHATDLVEDKATQVEEAPVVEKANEELFVIDTKGDSKAVCPQQMRQNPTKKEAIKIKKQSKSSLPLLDQKKVEKLVAKHDATKLQDMLKETQAKMSGSRRAVARNQQKNKPSKYDLWGDDDKMDDATGRKPISAKQKLRDSNAKANKVLQIGGVKGSHVALIAQPISKPPSDGVAVDLAHAGQSYRPDPKQYQAVVQDAVALELRRQKAQEFSKAPLAKGMSDETRALLVADSSSEDESEGEEDDATEGANVLHKRRDKLTRAQRNKQKRVRQERAIEDKQRRNKKLLKSVAEIPRFKKEIKKQAKESIEKKEKIEEVKKKQKGTPGKDVLLKYSQKDPVHAPTLPVALAAEHKDASLRTIKPKGSLITDRMASFADRNLVSKRKMGDKKRIVQGKRRKVKVKGSKGHDIVKSMAGAILG